MQKQAQAKLRLPFDRLNQKLDETTLALADLEKNTSSVTEKTLKNNSNS
jgi:hypothetical protein